MNSLVRTLKITIIMMHLFAFSNLNGQVSDSTHNKVDSLHKEYHFSGTISATNNGISFIPTFSLGKPASIFNLSIGGPRLSFDPELRFSLEGRPWSYIFWWRYKLLNNNKFKLNVGAHPALSFKTIETNVNGITTKSITAVRYVATELVPNYMVSNKVSVGIYYLYSHGLDVGATKNTHFITINSSISNIRLFNDLNMKIVPQLYYLKMDEKDGYYATGTVAIAKKNCPFSLTAVGNKIIHSNIPSNNFVWNTTIAYSFNNKFSKK